VVEWPLGTPSGLDRIGELNFCLSPLRPKPARTTKGKVMTDSSGHPDLDQAVPNLSDDHKLIALKSFQSELKEWNTGNCPSESGFMVEQVPNGHPLHAAVVTLQQIHDLGQIHDGELPKPALIHWREFLRHVRRDENKESEAEAKKLLKWVKKQLKASTKNPVNPKRSTVGGEARAKLIAALTKHHNYADGSCLNSEPIGVRKLAELAEVSASSASEFLKKEFAGYQKYCQRCRDTRRLSFDLKVLNGEFSPHQLYGSSPEDQGLQDDQS
jgi:hypothetical protein